MVVWEEEGQKIAIFVVTSFVNDRLGTLGQNQVTEMREYAEHKSTWTYR